MAKKNDKASASAQLIYDGLHEVAEALRALEKPVEGVDVVKPGASEVQI